MAEVLDLLRKGDVLVEIRRLIGVGRLAAIVGVGEGLLSHVDLLQICSDNLLSDVFS